ncbi:MAG TPA: PBP1A family penicillin-binding protein [Porticoccaceae bacterium]|nr:PBP1A family penicillin-binding protein [Porticoccaceae bacterium]
MSSIVRWISCLLCAMAGGLLTVTAALYLYLSPKLPSVEVLRTVKLQIPMRLYSQDLKLVGEFGEQRRTPIDFEQIPPLFIKALLAAEDDHFYSHRGVDFNGLFRAAFELVRSGSIQSGGSTITMQLARNFFLSREQSFVRKFNEILLAFRIEDEIDKNTILTLYCNKIFLGQRAYGIAAAAEAYYGKPLAELALPELAMIAGLPKAPSAFNPVNDPERARARRDWILGRMLRLGDIDEAAHRSAVATPVAVATATPQTHIEAPAPYVAEMARRDLLSWYGEDAYTDGLRVFLTIDSVWQQQAQAAVAKGLLDYDHRHGYRGPEQHLGDPRKWQQDLARTSVIQGLVPAIVREVAARQVRVQLADGRDIQLDTQGALAGIRLALGQGRFSHPVGDFARVFKPGDLIRLRPVPPNGWQLAQLPEAQAALVALDPGNGAIRALSGGFDFTASHFNRAVQARRQPGSSFKPFVYASALEHGMTAASIINDAPIVFDTPGQPEAWRPENDSGEFYGPTRLREALYRSRNLVSIRVLQAIGVNNAIASLARYGFNRDALEPNLSLALGTAAFTPMDMAAGFAIFANGGYRVQPYLIERVEDAHGQRVRTTNPPRVCTDCLADDPGAAPRAMDARIAYIMDSMLKDVIRRGTGTRALQLGRSDLAGKTGTTNGPRDAWFSGYSPALVTSVWLGFDDNRVLGTNEYGGTAALPIWMDFMGQVLAGTPDRPRPRPPGIVSVRIDPATGLRAGPGQPWFEEELFLKETVPAASLPMPETSPNPAAALPEDLF